MRIGGSSTSDKKDYWIYDKIQDSKALVSSRNFMPSIEYFSNEYLLPHPKSTIFYAN